MGKGMGAQQATVLGRFLSIGIGVLLIAGVVTSVIQMRAIAQTTNSQSQTELALAEADQLFLQGVEQFNNSQFEAALQSWQQSLQLYRKLNHQFGEENALNNLGIAYNVLGDYPKAIEFQEQALVIARESKAQEREGQILSNLGLAYFRLGNYSKAIESHTQSLVIAREVKNQLGESSALNNLGLVYTNLGDYPKSIEYYEQSLAIARRLKNRRREGTVLANLGNAYDSLGNYSKAIEYHEQALMIEREVKNRFGEGTSLGSLGIVYYRLGNYAKAIEYQEQSLAIRQAIKDRLGEGAALGNLGLAYTGLGNYAKAIEYQEQALVIAREIRDRLGEGQSLNNLGLAEFLSGNLPEAEKFLFSAIKVYESLRSNLQNTNKVTLADTQRSPYNTLQRVLIAQNKIESALEVAERGRARAFVELLAKRVQATPTEPTSISISEMQQVAKTKQATLVHYSVFGSDILYIWVIQPSGSVSLRQVDLTALEKTHNTTLANLVSTARCLGLRSCEQAIAQQSTRQIIFNIARVEEVQRVVWEDSLSPNQSLQQLHELLITPIADLLPQDPEAPVILIPQSVLFVVPFAALQDGAGTYLIDKHTILTAPSIQVLQLTQQQSQRIKQANLQSSLVVGNPVMPKMIAVDGRSKFSPPALPGAEQEARAIASLLHTQALTGAQATEAEIVRRMPQSRIIHLATHGIFNHQDGLQSAIALAPSPGDPTSGWLTADQILDLKLQAELVVLSACDTGRGRITGDGVIGLSRSLISAGVPSVLVSLWAVPDAPTALLMTRFYQNLQRQPNKARALRQAMLETKKDHPHPKDWAAFVLIGEME